MRYDTIVLSKLSNKLGVVRNTLEKVLRLAEILRFINNNDILKDKLALKGGTAINLLYSDLPRLSVDIDLDFAHNVDKNDMLKIRELIKEVLITHFTGEGYILSKHSRYSYALDSYVIAYTPSGGGSDNIKVEINYAMRSHILPLEQKMLDLSVIENPFSVLTVPKIEIYAGKINALLSRDQIRDLYDTYQMITNNLLDTHEIEILKNVVLFYRYIQNETLDFNDDFKSKFTRRSYVRDLLSVIKKGDSFNLDDAINKVLEFIKSITRYDENQKLFIKSIEIDIPRFDYLFEDNAMLNNAIEHPLTKWKQIKQ
ncbi:MAG: nucleotidyl transferase AbiEii/AbiGii toxin family protein [Acholeplasmataceae bacterium]